MKIADFKKFKLPDRSGVYFFYKGKSILYIGKATSLKDRVKSYFSSDLINMRGMLLVDMVTQADSIKWQETDNVLEALILEANLIKKYQPKYNTKEKDNKSFNYVCFLKNKTITVVRGRMLDAKKYEAVFGPFTNGLQLREALKIIRKIFPYIEGKRGAKGREEFYKQLNLLPKDIKENTNNIKNLKLFFQGKKKQIIVNFKKEMMAFAKKKEFEKANEIKRKIFALEHINDVALIKEDLINPVVTSQNNKNFSAFTLKGSDADKNFYNSASSRIEAYDIAHMSGKNMVGVMTVVENGEVSKKEYKKFIIKSQTGANDTGDLYEVLSRRFKHLEWNMPNLIVMDGSVAQVNIAKKVLHECRLSIPVVGVVKDKSHKAKAILGNENLIKSYKKSILLANVEAHRFAIAFHKKKRSVDFLK